MVMNIHDEPEADTRPNRISPALKVAGWGEVEGSHVRREVICPGRIQSGGKRGKGLSADYVVIHKGHKLAVRQAKRAGVIHRDGVGQAKDYATRLGLRFAYASNGVSRYQIDKTTGAEADMALPFPTPDELWTSKQTPANGSFATISTTPSQPPWMLWHGATGARILLTLATGTGKTSIAL